MPARDDKMKWTRWLCGCLAWIGLMATNPANLKSQETPIPFANDWTHWRGPSVTGVAPSGTPPLNWSVSDSSDSENLAWKVKLPGRGSSTPIILGEQVFVLTAMNTGRVDPSLPKPEDQPKRVFGIKYPNTEYDFFVICLDRQTGEEKWRRLATTLIPHEGTHNDNDFASASPTTDGKYLYCWFGSAGLFVYDLVGNPIWNRNLGKAYVGASLGEGASPVIHNDRLILLRDHSRQSTIHVLDAKTGETIWEKKRDEPNTWATPLVVDHAGRTQVITTGSNFVRSYDLDDGSIRWQCRGLTGNCIPCPLTDGKYVYCMSGYEGYSLLAISLNAEGDVSDSDAVAWSIDRSTPYIPSPVLVKNQLFFTQSNQAILSVFGTDGSEKLARTRLDGIRSLYASPVSAAGRVYFTGRNGTTVVVADQPPYKVLATNLVADRIGASAAIAGNQFFLRGNEHLYCFEQK